MPANDALLFIDANKYLELFRTDNGKKLLVPLGEQVDYIFITQQVVDEVQRNKIKVAADFLGVKSKGLKLQTFNVPDHLSGTSAEQGKDNLHQQMKKIGQMINMVNRDVDALMLSIIEQISCSEDEVSMALDPIFTKAVSHSPEELNRARDRRELGNPPGKSTDPIGDQLTWEQIITHFKGKKRLWIISGDSDYGTTYGSKSFLNYFLYDELCKVVSNPEVYLFKDTVDGFQHFVDTTGVKAEKRLTPEEVEEIKKEGKSLSLQEELGKSRLSSNLFNDLTENAKRLVLIENAALGGLTENAKRLVLIENAALGGLTENAKKLGLTENTARSIDELRQSLTPIHQQPTRGKKKKDKQPPTSPPSSQVDDKENEEDKAE